MEPPSPHRKLVTILCADVAGYSRLMGEDEEGTVEALKASRVIIDRFIERHEGRVFGGAGDSVVAEFPSAVEAVRAAVEIQEELERLNAERSEARRMRFRIGINLGDVLVEGEDLLGDGVNVAARLQALAEPGDTFISGSVFDQIVGKLALDYQVLGEQTLKNIARPLRVYRVIADRGGSVVRRGWAKGNRRRFVAMAAAAIVMVGLGVVAAVAPRLWPPSATPPEGASVAVLPFANLSGDAAQEYFSDGITEDIIIALGRFSDLNVISRDAVFQYKGKRAKPDEVARALNVRYVLEGSVRRADDKVRVTAQLSDATTGRHLWSVRYDGELADVFALQDEITHRVVGTLAVKLSHLEQERVFAKPTENLVAYDYLLRGRALLSRRTRAATFEAREAFGNAIELDPGYAAAYVGLGWTYLEPVFYGWTDAPSEALETAQALAQKALALDESNAGAHQLLGEVHAHQYRYDLAITELERAVELNPNDWESYGSRGIVLLWLGRHDEAIRSLQTASRFDPALTRGKFMALGLAHYFRRQYDEAIRALELGLVRYPDTEYIRAALAAAYAQSGRSEEAAREAAAVMRLSPFFEVESFGDLLRNPADRAHLAEGLRKAGLK